MTQHDRAALEILALFVEGFVRAHGFLDALRQRLCDLFFEQQLVAERIETDVFFHFALELKAFRNRDDRVTLTFDIARADHLHDLVKGLGEFRNQDEVCVRGKTRLNGDPAGVTTHALYNEAARVGSGGGVQTIDALHGDVARRIKTKGVIGAGEIVVDGLRHADHLHAHLRELVGNAERIVAADGNHAFEAEAFEGFADALRAVLFLHDVGAAALKNRTALGLKAFHVFEREPAAFTRQRAAPAGGKAVHFDARRRTFFDDAADNRVQAGAVSTTRENTNFAHVVYLLIESWLKLLLEYLQASVQVIVKRMD